MADIPHLTLINLLETMADFYYQTMVPLCVNLIEVMRHGMLLDIDKLERISVEMEADMNDLEDSFMSWCVEESVGVFEDPASAVFFDTSSRDHKVAFLFAKDGFVHPDPKLVEKVKKELKKNPTSAYWLREKRRLKPFSVRMEVPNPGLSKMTSRDYLRLDQMKKEGKLGAWDRYTAEGDLKDFPIDGLMPDRKGSLIREKGLILGLGVEPAAYTENGWPETSLLDAYVGMFPYAHSVPSDLPTYPSPHEFWPHDIDYGPVYDSVYAKVSVCEGVM